MDSKAEKDKDDNENHSDSETGHDYEPGDRPRISAENTINETVSRKRTRNSTSQYHQQQYQSKTQHGVELQRKRSVKQDKGKSQMMYQKSRESEKRKEEKKEKEEDSELEIDHYYQNYAGPTLSELEDSDSSEDDQEKNVGYDMASNPVYKKSEVSKDDGYEQVNQGRRVFKSMTKKNAEQPQQQKFIKPKAPQLRSWQLLTGANFQNQPGNFANFGAIGNPKPLPSFSQSYQRRPLAVHPALSDSSSDANSTMSDNMGESSNTTTSESELTQENLWGKGVHVTSGKKEDTVEPLSKFFPVQGGTSGYPDPSQFGGFELPQKQKHVKRDFDFPPVPFKPSGFGTRTTALNAEEGGIEAYLLDGSTEIASMEELNMRILAFSKYLQKITSSQVCKLEAISDANTHHELQPLFENRLFKVSWIVAQTKFNKREKETFNAWRLNKQVPKLRPKGNSGAWEAAATAAATAAAAVAVAVAASASASASASATATSSASASASAASASTSTSVAAATLSETSMGAGASVGGSLSKTLQRRSLSLLYPSERVTQTDIKQWNRRYYGEYGDLLNAVVKVLACYEDIIDDDDNEDNEEETETEGVNIGMEKLADRDPYKYYSTSTTKYRVGRKTMDVVRGYYKTQMRVTCAQQKMEICKRHNDAVKENADISKRIFGTL
ncbi:uncharacterized protein SAPINGB_P000085 [Magnusiomyces paraingens]|uniref:Uncharacterized protein n=1 Tax=Magnusiomyces paraingens TaxID=2606893 RepID=A0A5E8AY31_9ASCO|nr:uncharacterized protein SAPINGB_P000085 [Saprochaete ingens]VVT43658.1 unnamed protein product [Saprochaete ingens]